MKQRIIVRVVMILIAVALSVLIIRRDGLTNTTPCATMPACTAPANGPVGTAITMQYGFPVTYRETKIFRPTKNANYKEARLTQDDPNISAIVLNVIFWYALLDLLWRIRTGIMYSVRHKYANEETKGSDDTTPAPAPPTAAKS